MKFYNIRLINIPDFPDYCAGSDGNIYSFKGRNIRKLKSHPQGNGKYLNVVLRLGNKSITRNVHRLIAECFCTKSNLEGRLVVSHLDGDSFNNNPKNLVWETQSKNLSRRLDHNTDDTGIKNSRAKFNIEEIIDIRKMLKNGFTQKEIGIKYNVNSRLIGKISRG